MSGQDRQSLSWLYFSDQPVGTEGDRLWKEHVTRRQVSEIARRIGAPLIDAKLYPRAISDSLTFAIHGGWGSGKSSFLKMVIEETSRQVRESLGEAGLRRVSFCSYVASSYTDLGEHGDVRTLLAMRALTALVGSASEALGLYQRATRIGSSASASEVRVGSSAIASDPRVATADVGRELFRVAENLAQLVDFPEYLANELKGTGFKNSDGTPRVLAIFIDDLDRCRPEVVASILSTTLQWSVVENLFFVLAVDQNVLLDAIKRRSPEIEQVVRDPLYALEKYVQHSFSIPELTEEALPGYVTSLLEEYQDDISRTITKNVRFLVSGLRIKTPRAVKRCLNTIRPDIAAAPPAQDPELTLKERILEYSWREFYEGIFRPSVKVRAGEFKQAWRSLEEVCRSYYRDFQLERYDEDKLEFELRRIRTAFRDNEAFPQAFPRALARYLGEPPHWLIDDSKATTAVAANKPWNFRPVPLPAPGAPGEPDKAETVFMESYYGISVASDEDPSGALQKMYDFYEFVFSRRSELPANLADEVGNVALRAERLKSYDLASALFGLALMMKPDHPNNMQNYVSFVADAARSEEYERADAILTELRSRYPTFKADRLLYLEVQMAAILHRQVSVTEEQLEHIVEKVRSGARFDEYAIAMLMAGQLGRSDVLRELSMARLQHADTSSEVYLVVRGLADGLAEVKDDMVGRREALEIYRRMFAHSQWFREQDLPSAKHNYATLLYSHDYDDEAGRIWFEAYKEVQDEVINRAYAVYLGKANRPDLSRKVIAGEPLDEMVLQSPNKPMPDHFASAPYIDEMFAAAERMSQSQQSKRE
jgi:hypothetical protein